MPTTSLPPPPKHSSGPFVGAIILMLLLAGGLVYWKLSSSSDAKPVAQNVPSAAQSQQAPVDQIIPPPPPPPAASEDAGVSATPKKSVLPGFTGTGCSSCGKCTGEAAPSFASALRARASQAQRCYEKALSQQEGLEGRLSLNLCVGVGGAVCGASIANNSLKNSLVEQCVMNIYRATTFPSPKNGCVDASVPLNFVPAKK